MTITEQIQDFLKDAERNWGGKSRTESDVLYSIKWAVTILLRAELERLISHERSYADRADSATSFDPELQSDGDAERQAKTIHIEKNP